MPEEYLKIVGNKIKEARIEKEMKGETLAKLLGKTKAHISHIENGEVDLKISTLVKICRILEIEFCGLLCKKTFHSIKEFEDSHTTANKIVIDREVIEELIKDVREIKKDSSN